jgi:Leucine-rich repeat (LRR) protein
MAEYIDYESDYRFLSAYLTRWKTSREYNDKVLVIERLNLISLPPLPDELLDLRILKSRILSFSTCTLPPNIVRIDCNESVIDGLPDLPESLANLCIVRSSIQHAIEIPSSLKKFGWRFMPNVELPQLSHSSLEQLDVAGDDITSLPELPSTLRVLMLAYCSSLHELPNTLPPMLDKLSCISVPITRLPELPNSLTWLKICDTHVSILPDPLPRGLISLDCANTRIRSLPNELPQTLMYLCCSGIYLPPFVDFRERYHPNRYIARVKQRERFLAGLQSDLDDKIFNKKRTVVRCKAIKGELMERTWHPDRIFTWCGVDFERDDD